jgi:outer membrane protein assembly factor BamB
VWAFKVGGAVEGSMLIHNGALFVGCKKGGLFALDPKNGQMRWSKNLNSSIENAQPAGSDDIIVVGTMTKKTKIAAVRAENGAPIWTYYTYGPVESQPVIYRGVVYAGCHDGFVYALDLSTGRLRWRFLTGWDIDESFPLIMDNHLYIGSMDGRLYAFRL